MSLFLIRRVECISSENRRGMENWKETRRRLIQDFVFEEIERKVSRGERSRFEFFFVVVSYLWTIYKLYTIFKVSIILCNG